MKQFLHLALAAVSALLIIGNTQISVAQDVDLSKYPDWTPFDASQQKHMPQIKNRGTAKSMNRGPRPDHINNALSMYFPPVFNQTGGSCGSAQAIGYMFTHEMNSWRNKDASFEENQYPSHFTWLFTNTDVPKIDMMVANGIPNVPTYGGRTNSRIFGVQTPSNAEFGWMQGYDKWYSAMFNRSKEFFRGPVVSSANDEAREELKQWLWNRWGTEGYNDGGVAGFGVASGGYWGTIPTTATNNAIGVSGMKCVKAWGHTYDHGMTICGYDDRIEFDLDSNGVVGEVDKDEVGAWIICNSWGANWENKGFIYCPYKNTYCVLQGARTPTMSWATELYVHRQDHKPMRTIKLLMDYTRRWELSLSAGISQDTSATKPDATTDFVHFTQCNKYDADGESPEIPMLGRWADGFHDEPMEFGYDLTDVGQRFDKSKPLKYFFYVKTRGNGKGEGHLYKASIMNYEFDRNNPIEIPFKIDTIEIKGGQETLCISVVVPGEAVNAPLNAALNGNTLTWSAPETTSLPLTKYYIYQGGKRIDSTSVSKRTYTVTDPDASYSVAAAYNRQGTTLVSNLSNNASNPFIIEKGQNKVLTLTNNVLTIPNAIPKQLNQATIEFMFKAPALSGSTNKLGDEKGDFFLNISASGQVTTGWSTSGVSDYCATSASIIKANKWHHVAVVVDYNTITIYVDGLKKKSVTSNNYSGIPAMGDFVLGINGAPMNATIDEFRIWSTARTMSEIYSGKDDVISNPSAITDLIAYLPMALIEHEGETKAQEFVLAKHAYFDTDKYNQAVDETILNGSKLSTALTINCEKDTVTAGTPFKVNSNSPVSTTNWQWNTPGADNKAYTSQAPYITYNKAGEYTVELTITKADGKTETATKEICVLPAIEPVIDFDIADNSMDAGDVFSFINRSQGNGIAYTWTMKGAQVEYVNATSATAVYDVPGTYTVTLTGTNASGSFSVSKDVTVSAAAPTPAFSVNPTNILLGETTYLVDNSRGTADSWLWSLDNHVHTTFVNGQNSSFTPTRPGIYDISLNVANEVGQNTLVEKKLLCVSNADAKNSLYFSGNENVSFNSPISASSRSWTFDWWMNPAQYAGAGSFRTENDFAKMRGIANGAYRITLNNGTWTSNEGFIILNEWHHYAVSYNTGTIVLYRDGEVWQAPEDKLSYAVGKWGTNILLSDNETPFKGLIDELRIWGKAISADQIAKNANSPIANPTETENLVLYYNFNQGQGSVLDQTGKGNDGTRINFGPDGDAWPIVPGVFTLDLEKSGSKSEEVTSLYLTNYKAPFLYDANTQINDYSANRFYALPASDENSGWETRGAVVNGNVTTGAHVDKSYDYYLCVATSYTKFAGSLQNHRVFQPVILPAGKYTFKHASTSTVYTDMIETMVVATAGPELSTNENIKNALASKSIYQGKEIEFQIGKETEVSLGLLVNFASYDAYRISEFQLFRTPVEVLEADGETSIYDSIENGTATEAYGRDGGIMIASKEKKNFKIYTIGGQCVFNDDAQGVHFLPFDKGIYIVNGEKVIVK